MDNHDLASFSLIHSTIPFHNGQSYLSYTARDNELAALGN